MIEKLEINNKIYAIIVRNSFAKPGISFFTPDDFSQQLAYMNHPRGKIIEPHFHNEVHRTVIYTEEVLFIKKGILRVDFYNESEELLTSRELYVGDVILLSSGGHGFEVLEDVEMIEVKQGPYCGDQDKTRFQPKKKLNS
jgi:hypothetical protein